MWSCCCYIEADKQAKGLTGVIKGPVVHVPQAVAPQGQDVHLGGVELEGNPGQLHPGAVHVAQVELRVGGARALEVRGSYVLLLLSVLSLDQGQKNFL